MPKEWILNSVVSRFQLNFKRNVGAVSEAIRTCQPKRLEDWKTYYFSQVRSESDIESLGRKLYIKISEVALSEIREITEEECIDYMKRLVIDRTFDGYLTEIETIYGKLEKELGCKIEAAPDKWDRLYNVDFFIKVEGLYIGLQIKPITHAEHISQIHKERGLQAKTHDKFTKDYGGKVFYIFSLKKDGKKEIANPEVVGHIRQEIRRLEQVANK